MPELPEVETVRKTLASIKGKKINSFFRSNKKLRLDSALPLADIVGLKIKDIQRRARYLIINLSDNKSLIVHLGMSGKLIHDSEFRKLKHDHLALEFDDGSYLIFNDTRRFGFVDLVKNKDLPNHKMLSKLGVEPLQEAFNARLLKEAFKSKKMNIKTSIMDNKIVVGVGNIYACESLFDAKISPLRPANSLNDKELENLVKSIKLTIKKAIDANGSSIRDYVDSKGDSGSFQNNFKVYGRENEKCLICKDLVRKIKQNGRSTFYSPSYQK